MAPLGGLGVGSRRPNGAAPVRKLTIKPLKAPPRPPEGFEEDAWTSLSAAIDAIHDKTAGSSGGSGGAVPSYETLYRSVEDVCVHKKAPWLFEKLRAKLKRRVDRRVRELKSSSAAMDPVAFTRAFDVAWQEHCDAVDTTRRVFLYLDRVRAGGAAERRPSAPRTIWDVGVSLFRDALLGTSETGESETNLSRNTEKVDDDASRGARRAAGEAAAARVAGGDAASELEKETETETEPQPQPRGVSFDAALCVARGACALVANERGGASRDERGLLLRVARAFLEIGAYRETFEPLFLETTAARYAREGDESIAALDPFEYARHCEERLRFEAELCDDALDASTTRQATRVVARHLVEKHLRRMLDDGFAKAFAEKRVDDARRFFALARRCDGGRGGEHPGTEHVPGESVSTETKFVDAVRRAYGSSLKALGSEIVKDDTGDKDAVVRLLSLRRAADEFTRRAFESGEAFCATTREAFEFFMNSRGNKLPELLAKFADGVLRSQKKREDQSSNDGETERALDGALGLFRHVQGKDAFEAFYKKDLAKRLLLGKSASVDAEKAMISRLKAECGAQFTAKLEGMFKDVDASRDLMRAYGDARRRRADEDEKRKDVETYVNVLTAGSWPTYARADLNLPRELERARDAYAEFYLGKHSGRKLAWLDGLGHCVLRARFDNGEKELCTSTFQAAVLLLFNERDTMTASEIMRATNMEDGECRRTLQSLACGKTRVLLKTPRGREVADDDAFAVNAGFAERLFRVKINSIQMKETEEENAETNEKVAQDRQYQIDACLVRVMKTRKSLAHQALVSETFAHVAFPAKPADVKKRIESLIEREYLERDRNDPQTYNYLA